MKLQYHEMRDEELAAKLSELKQELFNLRFNLASGNLSNPMQLSKCKRDIARVKTIIRERELRRKA